MPGYAVIASDDELIRRLVEVLRPLTLTRAICTPRSALVGSTKLRDRVTSIGSMNSSDFVQQLVRSPELLAGLPEWVVWGNDMDLIHLARSPLPAELRLACLPVRDPRGLAILGSKTGLATLAWELGMPSPRGCIVGQPADLASMRADLNVPLIIKGERGAGGGRLLLVNSKDEMDPARVPEHWYPVLVQEFVAGREVAVEALFGWGRLLGWQYSVAQARESVFGRHTARTFTDPPTSDFVDALQCLAAAAGLHGFANCTFIRTADDQHLLVEADMRANAWHQFGPRLGVDWGRLMIEPPGTPVHPRFGADRLRVIHLFPRQVTHGIQARELSQFAPWLLLKPGTWDTRNHADQSANRLERREVVTEMIRLAQRSYRRIRRTTPPPGASHVA